MAKPSASKVKARAITRGSGNVFADLGLPDAEERQTKLRLAYALNTILNEQHLAQAAASARLGLNQPKVSALRNYKLEGFSVERLMTLLNALDQDVEIVIRAKPRSRAAARISVVRSENSRGTSSHVVLCNSRRFNFRKLFALKLAVINK